jgi:2-keto-4-pentenoate hydratase/2-oxohepta-3-ene-1,7-dioic acid hydratase in catechol pathway
MASVRYPADGRPAVQTNAESHDEERASMKIVRFLAGGAEHLGRLHDDGRVTILEGSLFGPLRDTGRIVEVEKLLAPLEPRDIICVGLNYKKHAAESGAEPPQHPVMFMKNSGAVQNPGDPILLPRRLRSDRVDYEAELAVVIGKTCHNVRREDAFAHVLGYTCGNDVSARDWQRNGGGGQWCRGKSFATFCPLGPALVTVDEIPDPGALGIRTIVGDRVLQDCTTADMIFDVPAIVEFFSASMILRPGTVILTGTPHGVGFARNPPVFLQPGDTVTVEIDRIGRLTNPVVEEPT